MKCILIECIDDTIARKVNGSDASSFAEICGCCPSRGPLSFFAVIYPKKLIIVLTSLLIDSLGRDLASASVFVFRCRDHCRTRRFQSVFLFLPIFLIGQQHLLNFVFFAIQQSAAQQKADSQHFLPVPGSHSGALGSHAFSIAWTLCSSALVCFWIAV